MTYARMKSSAIWGTEQLDAAIEDYSHIGRVHVAPSKDVTFTYQGEIYHSPSLAVGDLSVSSNRTTRTSGHAEEGNPYDVLGILLNEGEVEVSLRGRRGFRYSQAEAFLWRGDEAGQSSYLAPMTRLINVALPRTVLTAALGNLDKVAGRPLPDSPTMRLLAAYARIFLAEAQALEANAAQLAACHIQDLALMALGANRDSHGPMRGVRAARLKTIEQDIEAHLLDPELSIEWIVRKHRVSARYVRSLFADKQTCFSDFVMGLRLARAYRQLIDPRHRTTRISAIAYAAGFNDPAWFSRAFRRHYGMTPGEARARASQD